MQDCDLDAKASAALVGADVVLHAYFDALLAAATETNFTVQPGLDAAAASFAAIPGVDPAPAQAITGLAGLLAGWATEAMRQRTLRDLITRGGPPAQAVIGGMRQLVAPRLRGRLDAERTNLTTYFARAILAQRDAVGSDPEALCGGSGAAGFSATGFLLTQHYCERLAIVTRRQAAVDSYDASLKAASDALVELQSAKTRLKARALADKLFAIGRDLDDKVTAVRKAFT